MMTIGVSIKSTGLRKDADISERRTHLAGFSHLRDYLNFLQAHDVKSIELRIYTREDSYEMYQEAIEMIWKKGFHLTIHGDLAGDFWYGESFGDVYPSLVQILKHGQLEQTEFIMPIHAFQSTNSFAPTLKDESVQVFKQWISLIESEEIPLYFALENNREKKLYDPCDNLQGVIDIVHEVNSPHLGICWDMGHYDSNLLHKRADSVDPAVPNAFLERVIHTHIHGLNEESVTHCSLSDPLSLPLEMYVDLLKKAHYTGIYNVEMSFDRWDGNVQHEFTRSLQRLKRAVAQELVS